MKDAVGFSGESWPQYQDELARFIELLTAEGVRSYMEVGCRYGDTMHAVGCALPQGSTIVGVDWGRSFVHEPGRSKRREDSAFKRERLQRCVDDLRSRGQKASVILGDSRAMETRQLAMLRGPYDAVFIDAGHSRDDVDADWFNYGAMGRVVAFHDVCSDGRRLTGPGALFDELSKARRAQTISVDPIRRGIGVIWTR